MSSARNSPNRALPHALWVPNFAPTFRCRCIAFVMFVFPGVLDVYRYMNFEEDRTPVQLARGLVLATTGIVAGTIGLFGSLLPFSP